MDGRLKFLIAVACLVVIAAGGYYACLKYTEWSSNREVEQARTYLFNRAEASPSDREKIDAFCKKTLQHIASGGTDNEFINQDGALCRAFKYGQ